MITAQLTDKSDLNEYALVYVLCSFLTDAATSKNSPQTIEIMCDFIEYKKIQNLDYYLKKYNKHFNINEVSFISKLYRLSQNTPYTAQFLQSEFESNFDEEQTQSWFNPQNSSAIVPDDVAKAKQCIFFQAIRIINQAYEVELSLLNRFLKLVSNDSFLGESVYLDIKNYDNNDLLMSYIESFLATDLKIWEKQSDEILLANLIKAGLYINGVDHQNNNLSMDLIDTGKNPLVILFLYKNFGLNIYQKNKAGKCAYDWLKSNNWIIEKKFEFDDTEEERIRKIKQDNISVQIMNEGRESYLKQLTDWNKNSTKKLKSLSNLSKNQKFLKLGSLITDKLNVELLDLRYDTSMLIESDTIENHLDTTLISCIDKNKHLNQVNLYAEPKFKIYKDINDSVIKIAIDKDNELNFLFYNTHVSDKEFMILSQSWLSKNSGNKYNGHNIVSLAVMQKRWEVLPVLLGKSEVREFLQTQWPDFAYTMVKKVPNFIEHFKNYPYLIDMKNLDGNTIIHICAKHHLNSALAQIIKVAPSQAIHIKNNEGQTFMNYIESNTLTPSDKLNECIVFFSKTILEANTKIVSIKPSSSIRHKI